MADKLRPNTTIRRPWNGYKTQAELNEERSGIPLMSVVNTTTNTSVDAIRNSSNCQSTINHGLYVVNEKTSLLENSTVKIGRFKISHT